jgi:hypothetical protein
VIDPTDVRDFYEERAALIEFDGAGISRPRAETLAIHQTAREFKLTTYDVRKILRGGG